MCELDIGRVFKARSWTGIISVIDIVVSVV
jgi:hypothetical protein